MKFLSLENYPSIRDVEKAYPGQYIVFVEGGYMVFETARDFYQWRSQA